MSREAIWSSPSNYRGWLVVAAAFAVTFVGFGSAYTFSALFSERTASLFLLRSAGSRCR